MKQLRWRERVRGARETLDDPWYLKATWRRIFWQRRLRKNSQRSRRGCDKSKSRVLKNKRGQLCGMSSCKMRPEGKFPKVVTMGKSSHSCLSSCSTAVIQREKPCKWRGCGGRGSGRNKMYWQKPLSPGHVLRPLWNCLLESETVTKV